MSLKRQLKVYDLSNPEFCDVIKLDYSRQEKTDDKNPKRRAFGLGDD